MEGISGVSGSYLGHIWGIVSVLLVGHHLGCILTNNTHLCIDLYTLSITNIYKRYSLFSTASWSHVRHSYGMHGSWAHAFSQRCDTKMRRRRSPSATEAMRWAVRIYMYMCVRSHLGAFNIATRSAYMIYVRQASSLANIQWHNAMEQYALCNHVYVSLERARDATQLSNALLERGSVVITVEFVICTNVRDSTTHDCVRMICPHHVVAVMIETHTSASKHTRKYDRHCNESASDNMTMRGHCVCCDTHAIWISSASRLLTTCHWTVDLFRWMRFTYNHTHAIHILWKTSDYNSPYL